ncbi:hypothetical protein E3N88_05526 [Mikania micrantha]|uniref:CCHC-type domain-containing protein n=1 Tax=Mikania micrantha TaxID=192012 RepID=A0A5N6PNC7_9ASTR|nr:hypothetical protein E3N88_05526 [Mikania micrantha]
MAEGGGVRTGTPTREPSAPSLQCPMLNKTNYTIWTMRLRAIFNVHGVWDQIEPGTTIDAKKNHMAIALLFQSVPEEQLLQIGNLTTAKEMWEALKSQHLGADRVREARLQTLMSDFEALKMKENSTVDDFTIMISGLASKSSALGAFIDEQKMVKKFLNGLPRKFIHMVASIEQMVDLKTITFDDVVGRLKAYEERIKDEDVQESNQGKLMFHKNQPSCSSKPQTSYQQGLQQRAKGKQPLGARSKEKGTSSYQPKKTPDGNKNEENHKQKKDRSKIMCYRCDKLGHFASVCLDRKQAIHQANLNETEDLDPALFMAEALFTIEPASAPLLLNEEKIIPSNYERDVCEEEAWYLDNGASNHMT